jgi:glycosyltransferase involved in cell wall biosynthesis
VDTALFDPARRSAALRAEWGVDEETPVALVVGRVSGEKNIGLAIRAFARMRLTCPEMKCIVVGDGPALTKLKRDHPEVDFPGYLTGEKLATCYASADIMFFPSETETFGNVLTEGMASGLATLSYDYAAAGWHCVHGVNGLKVKKGDEAAYLDAAETLLDPTLRRKLGSAARQTGESLGWPSVVAELEGIFTEVIQQHRPKAG